MFMLTEHTLQALRILENKRKSFRKTRVQKGECSKDEGYTHTHTHTHTHTLRRTPIPISKNIEKLP